MSSSTPSLSTTIINECAAIAQNGSAAINSLVSAAKSGTWTTADTNQFVALVQPVLQYLGDYNSVGIVVSGSAELGIGAEEVVGVVGDTTSMTSAPYIYQFLGVDVGVSEGMDASVGMIVAQGKPSSLHGFHTFADASMSVGAGIGVQVSTDGQWFIFFDAGEDADLSAGEGHVTVKQL